MTDLQKKNATQKERIPEGKNRRETHVGRAEGQQGQIRLDDLLDLVAVTIDAQRTRTFD